MKLKRIQGWDGIPFWRDGQGREFRRVAGGMSWPCEDLPGWLVVLGEERLMRPEDGRRHMDVLLAWQGKQKENTLTPRDIMAEARAVSVTMACHVWASPTELPDAALLPMYNRELSRRDPRLVLRTPPQYERNRAFLLYDRLLERRTGPENTFHAGEEGLALVSEYAVTRPADRVRPLEDFPAVAALLYALAWLELTAYTADRPEAGRYVAPSMAGY